MPGAALGLDIGGTKVLGLAVDVASGRVVAEHRVPTPSGSDDLVEALVEVVDALTAASTGDPLSVGVGAAGLVDGQGVLRFGPNLPGVVGLDLVGLLEQRIHLPVVVDNDATAATVAEHRLGAARDVADAVYVALGTGIGGGVVLDGEIRRGAHGFAGELGHMVIDPTGPVCGCGRRGCWEQMASGSALGELARGAVADGRGEGILRHAADESVVEGEHVVAAASEGDPGGLAVLDEYARWVALGLASLVNLLDPTVVVIGGGVVEAGDLLMRPVRAAFGEQVLGAAHRPAPPIVPAAFGEHAAAVGAALIGAERA